MHGSVVLKLACASVLLVAPATATAETPEIVEQALQALEATDLDHWDFVETVVENGTALVQRHDPTRPAGRRWTLLSVDGREPTADEREKHTNRRSPEGDDSDADEGEVRAMIAPDSLALVEETPTHWVYSFEPRSDDADDAKLYEHVDATLRIARDGPWVESIELRSRGPFSAGFAVKIREFELAMTFAPVGETGVVLPRSVSVRMAGRALLVKKIDETVEVRYSDYRFVDVNGPASD